MKDKLTLIAIVVFSLVVFGGLILLAKSNQGAGKLDYGEFISCLAEKEAKFYGAFWCPHCQDQKNKFGGQDELLAEKGVYIECSNPDRSQNELCTEEGIESYPTWEINGERFSGVLELEALASGTSCVLPTEVSE
jgi:hypothetical protein